jgi:localization factor PodJL
MTSRSFSRRSSFERPRWAESRRAPDDFRQAEDEGDVAAAEAPGQASGERSLESILSSLNRIGDRIRTLSSTPPATDAPVDESPARIRRRLRAAEAGFGAGEDPHAVGTTDSRFGRLQRATRLLHESERAELPREAPANERGFDALTTQIEAINRRQPDTDMLASLERRLDDIRQRLEQRPDEESHRLVADRVDELSDRFERSPMADPEAFRALEAQLSGILNAVASSDVARSVGHVGRRVEDVALRLDDLKIAGDRLDRLAARVETLPRMAEDISRRIGGIERLPRMAEDVSAMRLAMETRREEDEHSIDILLHRLEGIAGRLESNDVRTDLAELAAMRSDITETARTLERLGAATGDALPDVDMLVARIAAEFERRFEAQREGTSAVETRLGELAARIDGWAGPSLGGPLTAIEQRLDEIADGLSAMTGRAGGPDMQPVLARLEEEMAALRGALVQPATAAGATIERELHDLGERFDKFAAGGLPGLEALETQLARLADQMDARPSDTAGIADALERLEERLVEALEMQRDGSAAAARTAAQEAIAALKKDGDDDRLAEDLRSFRDELRDIAMRDRDTLGVMRDMLNRLVEAPATAAVSRPLPVEETESWQSIERALADGLRPARERPAKAASDRRTSVAPPTAMDFDENGPLEPGSGAPPLRVAIPGERDEPRTDFIAAARRAAQAASAESPVVEPPLAGDEALLQADVPSGRRRLLVGVGFAALLVLSAVLGVRFVFGGGEPVVVPDVEVLSEELSPSANTAVNAPAAIEAPAMEATAEAPVEIAPIPEQPAATPLVEPEAAVETQPTRSVAVVPDAAPPIETAPAGFSPDPVVGPPEAAFAAAPEVSLDDTLETASIGPIAATLPGAIGPLSLRQAAERGDPAAQVEVAARFGEGRGVTQNMDEAASWYRRAAEAGFAPAQYRLGSLYEKGQGVARDATEAARWYELAAASGNAKAMHNLAVLHVEGALGEPDYAEGARRFEEAAVLGVRDSQYNLGILYARGLGVERDLASSYKWFALAAAAGDADAAQKRDDVARALDASVLAQAELAVETWQPAPLVASANEPVPVNPAWETAPQTASAPGGDIAGVQARLAALGFDPGPADGVMGAKTVDAIIAFQRASGLQETGMIDDELMGALAEQAI